MENITRYIGSCRCKACDKELEDYENVYCLDCGGDITLEDDTEESLDNIYKDYIEG